MDTFCKKFGENFLEIWYNHACVSIAYIWSCGLVIHCLYE